MRNLFRDKAFWLGFGFGTLGMLALSLYQLGWLNYLFYDFATARLIPVTDFDIWFAGLIALLTGFTLGGFLHLFRLHKKSCQPGKAGWLGAAGAGIGAFTLACFACDLALLTAFGVSINLVWLTPYLSALRFVSLGLLIIAAYLIIRKVRNPVCQLRK